MGEQDELPTERTSLLKNKSDRSPRSSFAKRRQSSVGRKGSIFVKPKITYPFHPALHPRSAPSQVPFRRRERHRHPLLRATNDFRHWWKTSRLLVRLSGSLMYLRDPLIWSAVLVAKVSRKKERKV